jgi:ankyrin repeat protein
MQPAMKTIALLAFGMIASGAAAAPLDDRLLEAVRNGDHAQIRALLAKHVDVNLRLADKSTALSWAIDRQDEESVNLLMAAGAKVNLADVQGADPILMACEGGNPAIVRRLLAAGANARSARKDGTSALSLCAASSSPEAVAMLLAPGTPVDAPDSNGQTPLMFAAAHGQIGNVQLLIKKGAKVNRATQKGFTPLFFAIKSGVAGATEAIVDAGGDVAYVAPDGTTALHIALFARNIAAAKYLIEHGADLQRWNITGRQPLHAAVELGDLGLAQLLLAKGADPNGLTKTAFRTVPHQADPYQASRGGTFTPASTDGNWKPTVIYMALDGAAEPKAPAPASPLILAAKHGSVDMMKILVAGGAKPALNGPDGMSVLLASAGSGSLDTVTYAMQIDPDVTHKAGGLDAMQIALLNTRAPEAEAIVQYLADHGTPLDGKNDRGQTTAAIAERATPGMKALYAKLVATRTAQVKPLTQ